MIYTKLRENLQVKLYNNSITFRLFLADPGVEAGHPITLHGSDLRGDEMPARAPLCSPLCGYVPPANAGRISVAVQPIHEMEPGRAIAKVNLYVITPTD